VDELKSGIDEGCFNECLSLKNVLHDRAASSEEWDVWICSDPIYGTCTQANGATTAQYAATFPNCLVRLVKMMKDHRHENQVDGRVAER
jgi:hypothetical protein